MRIENPTHPRLLKHTIRFERVASVLAMDARGHSAENWRPMKTAKARIETLSGEELEIARKVVATATHRVTVHRIPNVTEHDRIRWRQRTLSIGHVNDIENCGVEQRLICTETL